MCSFITATFVTLFSEDQDQRTKTQDTEPRSRTENQGPGPRTKTKDREPRPRTEIQDPGSRTKTQDRELRPRTEDQDPGQRTKIQDREPRPRTENQDPVTFQSYCHYEGRFLDLKIIEIYSLFVFVADL